MRKHFSFVPASRRLLGPKDAFKEVYDLVMVYDQPFLLLGACQIRFGHQNIAGLTDQEKMMIAADIRPALLEIKHFTEQMKKEGKVTRFSA